MLSALIATAAAPTAAAHSRLESSVPAANAAVATSPPEVSLTFNEPIQEAYAVLTVVGPDGHFWQDGAPKVDGPTLSVGLRRLGPAGTYTVNYRVTSADGHPVEGRRTFELTVAAGGSPGPLASTAQTTTDDGGVLVWPFIVAAVVILVGGLALVFFMSRRSGRSGRS